MSAFLGPVHYWLYRKIQYQEQLNQKILKRICPQLKIGRASCRERV